MAALYEIWFVQNIILPSLDVLLLSFLIYKGYQIILETRAVQVFRGGLFLGGLYAVSFFLNLRTLLWLINLLAPSFVIGVAIIFQPELRKIFTKLGQGRWMQPGGRSRPHQFEEVLSACENLSRQRRGALIAFPRSVGLKDIINTGTVIDAEVTSALLQTFFLFDTPLHDGAAIIEDGRIASAGSFLPLSEQTDVRRSFGTRHRAALGLAEESDAVVLIVSEETGFISLAYDANLYYDLSIDEVRTQLVELLDTTGRPARKPGKELEEVAELED
ncbi:diadenylate cyclase [Alkalispirochaeta americana]|uniref:Diadenylate cyclase n=1 Tax=Alkalispirochaeta americana TaxID=159291 RepID=A0A1N6VNE5_9SPIO|nr:diadenylate cyclase CdaA [Alkalispirochaeta americana]SIQ79258.1 diadenylate cyclase [Alkalispirochaeta americana]